MMNHTESVRTATAEQTGFTPLDQRLLAALREGGVQTIEQLTAAIPDRSWPQVFLAIDRLSRSGSLFLRRTNRGDYQVSLNRTGA